MRLYNRNTLAKELGLRYNRLWKAEQNGLIPAPTRPWGKRFVYRRNEAEKVRHWAKNLFEIEQGLYEAMGDEEVAPSVEESSGTDV